MLVNRTYNSVDVAIPPDFLSVDHPPPDARPITLKQIDFAQTPLPQYKGLYAVVLDHVLSPSECQTLLRLAESSVPEADRRQLRPRDGDEADVVLVDDPWRPALVNVGGEELLLQDYRNSDRIIWDQQDVVDRLWARCATAPGLTDQIARLRGDSPAVRTRGWGGKTEERWEFRWLNKRMRFLKYQPGQFFRPHCDDAYREPGEAIMQTLFTVHLYLNDSKVEAAADGKEAEDAADLIGGATSFLSSDEKRKLDVDPKAGRVLIFQHRGLYHSGDDVVAGTKYTMRTDILYEMVGEEQDDD